jgi:hypothetical protein
MFPTQREVKFLQHQNLAKLNSIGAALADDAPKALEQRAKTSFGKI